MIHKAENYYGVKDYSKLCGVSERNIRDRIKARSVSYVKLSGFCFINAHASPPVQRVNPFKPVRGNGLRVQSFSFDGLKEVGVFCRGKHFSEGIVYEAILTDKLDAYIIADKVFIKPPEAEEFYKNRKKMKPSKVHVKVTFRFSPQPVQAL